MGKVSQIQICPWFINYAKGKKYNTWTDVQKKTKIFKWSVPKLDGGWPLTPVDSAALLEKVLLHELSHTNSAGQNVDVCLPVHVPGA